MRKLSLTALMLLLASFGFAQKVTYSGQVAGILYNNCTSCHRDGSIAPFNLQNYSDAYNVMYAIRNAVENKVMPPWSPDPSYTSFCNQRQLSQTQVDLIKSWVDGGGERGDSTQEPQLPTFDDYSQISNPDFSKRIRKHLVLDTLDEFKFFALPSGLTSDAYIKQLELVPGNRKIVHHAFIFLDTTGHFTKVLAQDSNLSLHGNNYLSGGDVDSLKLIGGWLPGGSYYSAPGDFCFHIPKKSTYILQIHYAPGSRGQTDSSQLNVKYVTSSSLRYMNMKPLLNNADSTDGRGCKIFIPANTIKVFKEEFTVPEDITLISITPHMHKIGKFMEVCAYNPNSANDTIKLISDKWDFHWQGMYTFPKAVHIPKGYVLLARGIYDNTTANTSNPNSPPKDIVAGTSTLTEMMQVFFCYVPYVQGDEAMSFDTTGSVTTVVREASKESETFALWPNPCASGSELIMNLSKPAVFNATLFSSDGKALQNYTSLQGNDKTRIQLPELSKGVYILKLYNSTDVMTKKLLVQ